MNPHTTLRRLTATNTEDDRPWEPLNGGPVRVGDEVRQDLSGLTSTAVVGRVDEDGDPWTAEGRFIGALPGGAWYVRRAAQTTEEVELPSPPERTGAIIEGVDGGRIQATAHRVTYTAAEAIYRYGGWYGAWRTASGGTGIKFSSSAITPGTWQEALA